MLRLYFKKFLAGLRLAIIIPFCLTKGQKIALRGKLRRYYLANLNKKKADFFLSHRKGACIRCGNCCQIGFKCPAYDAESGACTINSIKPLLCKMFPITPADLGDRDTVSLKPSCGFYWEKSEKELSHAYQNVSK